MNKKFYKKILSLILILTFVFSAFGIVRATAETKAFTLTNAKIKEKSDTVEASASIKDGNVVTDLTFHKLNDYIIYTLTFKNNDSKDYTIKGITDNNGNEYVKYEYDKHAGETIKAGDTKDIELKVSYVKEVTDLSKRSSKDSVKLSFEIEDEEGNTVTANVVVNPKTNDGIMMYVILASASVIGLAVLLLKNKKSGKLLVLAALLAPFVAKAAEASFIITINGELKLHDKVLVTTDVNGEKVEKLIAYQEKATKPADPEIDGQDFLGWFIGEDTYDFTKPVADDVVIVAKFKKTEYTVTFNPNGGKVATESVKFTKGEKVQAEMPFPRDNKIFTGWYDGAESTANLVIAKDGEFTPTGNITVYAHWEDGQEANLIDTDNSNSITNGDIVKFGPEEFVVIYSYSKLGLVSVNPLGRINGTVKQSATNPIKTKYADSVYWGIAATSSSGRGAAYSEYDDYGFNDSLNYVNNYFGMSDIPDLTKQNNLLYEIIDDYYDYLEEMLGVSLIHDDAKLLEYDDLHYSCSCVFEEANTCRQFIKTDYDYWIGSSFYDVTTHNGILEPNNAYYDSNSGMIKNTSISNELNVRAYVVVPDYSIIAPWDIQP